MHVNLHYLELFYYVGCHGGPARASVKMPYGIDPSAVSRQLCELERQMGVRLYERRPFKLTPVGERVFALIKPVMGDLPGLVEGWRKGLPDMVRLGGSPIVLREYLPPVLKLLKETYPGLHLTCNEGSQAQIESWLKEQLIDLAVILLEGKLPPEYESESLARLPLVVLVPVKSKLRSVTDLWRRREIHEPLVRLPQDHPVTQAFRKELKRRGLDWPGAMEANSPELVETYVKQGLGIGMSLAMPNRDLRGSGLRALPLADFPVVTVGMVWRRGPSEALASLTRELRRAAERLMKARGAAHK